jgi:hypothetical protein
MVLVYSYCRMPPGSKLSLEAIRSAGNIECPVLPCSLEPC